MANLKDGHGHKDKYFDTSRKFLSQKILMCNIKPLILLFRSYDQCQFKILKKVKSQGQKV